MISTLLLITLLFLGFLLLLAGIGFFAYRVTRRTPGDTFGAAGGCALAAVLISAAGLALIGFLVTVGVVVANRIVDANPIERVRLHFPERDLPDWRDEVDAPEESVESPQQRRASFRLEVEVKGPLARHIEAEEVGRALKELDVDARVIGIERWEVDGEPRARLRVDLPVDERLRERRQSIDEHLRRRFGAWSDGKDGHGERVEGKDALPSEEPSDVTSPQDQREQHRQY